MQMTSGLDEGPIILSKSMKINKDDNKVLLEERLTDLAIENILKVLVGLKEGLINPTEQDHSQASYCNKISKVESLTDFKDSATNIINKFKAYFEWPGLSFIFKENRIKIHEISIVNEKSSGAAGSFNRIDSSGIYFNTSDYIVVITYLQFPNKNIISSLDAFNSYQSFFE
jgi:methionyl-tRNA formyltransferase